MCAVRVSTIVILICQAKLGHTFDVQAVLELYNCVVKQIKRTHIGYNRLFQKDMARRLHVVQFAYYDHILSSLLEH